MSDFGKVLSSYTAFRACFTNARPDSAEAEDEITENFLRDPRTGAIAFPTHFGYSVLINHFEIETPEFRLTFNRFSDGTPQWRAHLEDKQFKTISGSLRVPAVINEYLSSLLTEAGLDYALNLEELDARTEE